MIAVVRQIASAVLLISCTLAIIYLGALQISAPIWPLIALAVVGLFGLSEPFVLNLLTSIHNNSGAEGWTVLLAGVAACVFSGVAILYSDRPEEKQRLAEVLAAGFFGYILGVNFTRIKSPSHKPPSEETQ